MTKRNQKRAHARRALPPVYELAAFSVFGFCVAHGLSRTQVLLHARGRAKDRA